MCDRHFSCWGFCVYRLSALANVTCSGCLGLRQWQRVYLSKWVMLIKVTSCVIVFVHVYLLLLLKLIQHFFWNLCLFVFTFVSLLYVDLFVYFPAFLFCSSCSEVLSFYLGSTLVSWWDELRMWSFSSALALGQSHSIFKGWPSVCCSFGMFRQWGGSQCLVS